MKAIYSKLKNLILGSYQLENFSFSLYRWYLRHFTSTIIGNRTKVGPSCILNGNNRFGDRTKFIGSSIGFASYISNNASIQNTKIGKFCSIGPFVRTIHGTHPTKKFVSTHPAFFSTANTVGFSFTDKQLFKESPDKIDPDEPYTTSIGNDVWIGASVNIIEGVQIGDGAIVASGALVNRDIPPYTIFGGVPARFIRKRFNDSEIEFLMELKWWDKPKEWMKQNVKLFSDIKTFNNFNKKH